MASQVRTALLSLSLHLSDILTVTAYADHAGGCFQGTYFVRESSGTQSLWTFSQDGTYQSASSAEVGPVLATYKLPGERPGSRTALDRFGFSFNDSNGDIGAPPLRTARVDAVMSFTNKCEKVEGTFEVGFFGPDNDPVSEPGEFVFPIPLPGGVSWLISLLQVP